MALQSLATAFGAHREVGQIRLGKMGKSAKGKPMPQRLTHFLFLRRNSNGEWEPDDVLHGKYGAQPRGPIPIYLTNDDPDEAFVTGMALYRGSARGKFCEGDEVNATVTLFPGDCCTLQDGEFKVSRLVRKDGPNKGKQEIETARKVMDLTTATLDDLLTREKKGEVTYWRNPGPDKVKVGGLACLCPLSESGAADDRKCKPYGILKVQLADAGEYGGAHVLRTTGKHSIYGIGAFLRQVHRDTNGVLCGIPFMLRCAPQKVSTPTGQQQTATVAYLTVPFTIRELMAAGQKIAVDRIHSRDTMKSLTGEVIEEIEYEMDTPEEAQAIAEEFFPDHAEPGEEAPAPEEESQEPEVTAEELEADLFEPADSTAQPDPPKDPDVPDDEPLPKGWDEQAPLF